MRTYGELMRHFGIKDAPIATLPRELQRKRYLDDYYARHREDPDFRARRKAYADKHRAARKARLNAQN